MARDIRVHQQLDKLLEICTVKLKIPKKNSKGTGFFVAPGQILTCAHVVKNAGTQPVQVSWQNQTFFAEVTEENCFSDPFDLALLKFEANSLDHPCVYLDEAAEPETLFRSGDNFYIYGYSDDFPQGVPITTQCEGLTGGAPPVIKFKAGQIRPGLSGSPVLNQRTKKVCGIVKFTLGRGTDLGGGAIPATAIRAKLAELSELQTLFHRKDQRWRILLPRMRCRPRTTALSSLTVASIMIVTRFLGLFTSLELQVFDFLMRIRLDEPLDDRLAVVEIDAEDFKWEQDRFPNVEFSGSIADEDLYLLLQTLETYKPRAIGIDLYRERVISDNLKNLLANSENIFAVCKGSASDLGEKEGLGYKPPPEISANRVGFSDFVHEYNVVRRQLLIMDQEEGSPCSTENAFSLQLARHYLAEEEIEYTKPEPTKQDLQFGDIIFKRLTNRNAGGYQWIPLHNQGYQILLNYRLVCSQGSAQSGTCSPNNISNKFTLRQVLEEQSLKAEDVQDKIVLIGTTEPSLREKILLTPYGPQEIPGVFIQAQMISQILSAVLDKRRLLEPWSFWQDWLWIGIWSGVGGGLAWSIYSKRRLLLVITVTSLGISIFCWVMLIYGVWAPLAPPILTIVTAAGWIVYLNFRIYHQ